MARQRNPQSVEAEKLFREGTPLVDIAEKLGVPAGTVRRWKHDQNWDGKQPAEKKTAKKKKTNVRKDKPSVRNHGGAPPGNQNALGNSGGAPPGNQNAFKHGGYSAVFWDSLDDEEQEMIDQQPDDEEQLLIDEIKLLSVRERRIMRRIKKYSEVKGGLAIRAVMTTEHKRKFATPADKELYEEKVREKIEAGDRLPGEAYTANSQTEATYDIVLKLEEALTRCQAQKQRCLDTLFKLRQAKGAGGSDLVKDWIEAVMGENDDGQ